MAAGLGAAIRYINGNFEVCMVRYQIGTAILFYSPDTENVNAEQVTTKFSCRFRYNWRAVQSHSPF